MGQETQKPYLAESIVDGNISIRLWDLTDPEKARERNVPGTGYYFTVEGLEQSELQDEMLISRFTAQFNQQLFNTGLNPTGDTIIHTSRQDQGVMFPNRTWNFIAVGYKPSLKMLVVKTEKVDPDLIQGKIVRQLNSK